MIYKILDTLEDAERDNCRVEKILCGEEWFKALLNMRNLYTAEPLMVFGPTGKTLAGIPVFHSHYMPSNHLLLIDKHGDIINTLVLDDEGKIRER